MKKIILLFAIMASCMSSNLFAQDWEDAKKDRKGTLVVHYFENEPYAYTGKNGKLMGLEVDILRAFVNWVKEEKEIDIALEFKKYDEFQVLYGSMQDAPSNAVGAASITITPERQTQFRVSAPYLKNVAVLVTDGVVGTARTEQELSVLFSEFRPITIKGSIHQQYMDEKYKELGIGPRYTYVNDAEAIPAKMKESAKYFGYMDIISFWKYIKKNNHYVKMHAVANKTDEEFGFIFSSGSDWIFIMNEFFESGFGFTATKEYRKILEAHLGYEVLEKVELDY